MYNHDSWEDEYGNEVVYEDGKEICYYCGEVVGGSAFGLKDYSTVIVVTQRYILIVHTMKNMTTILN